LACATLHQTSGWVSGESLLSFWWKKVFLLLIFFSGFIINILISIGNTPETEKVFGRDQA
jgi:hypothetical protein